MKRDRTEIQVVTEEAPQRQFFTLVSANEALVYVRRIVEDVARTYRDLMKLRDEHNALVDASPVPAQIEALRPKIEQLVERLNELHGELSDVGCELKDWKTGLIDFPALHQGRTVWLCWKLGEPEIAHWHEIHEGFTGRKPIDAAFAESLSAT